MNSQSTGKDYQLSEAADGSLLIRLPPNSVPIRHLLYGYLFITPFLIIGIGGLIGLVDPQLIGAQIHAPTGNAAENVGGYVVAGLFFGVFALLGGASGFLMTFNTFGRTELRFDDSRIAVSHRLGPIRFSSTRNLKSLLRLSVEIPVVTPSTKEKKVKPGTDPDTEPMSLFAYFSDQDRIVVAKLFRRSMLERLAREVIHLSPRFGIGRDVFLGDPPVRATAALRAAPGRPVIKPLVVAPAPKGSRLVASEASGGAVRIVIRRNFLVAIISGVVLMLMIFSFLTEGTGHAAWLHSIFPKFHNPKPIFSIAVALFVTIVPLRFLIGGLTMRVFDADNAALTRTIEGPFGRRSKRWNRDEIEGIDVKSSTRSRGKGGGTYTVHTLELRRKTGRAVVLAGNLKPAELEWMREMFSAALRIPKL